MSDIATILPTLPNFVSLSGASDEAISKSESELEVTFAEDYLSYVTTYGAASVNSHELTGVCKSVRLNVVAVTEKERLKNTGIPSDWYVVEEANIDGIVIWQNADGVIFQAAPRCKPEKIAESLLEYITKE